MLIPTVFDQWRSRRHAHASLVDAGLAALGAIRYRATAPAGAQPDDYMRFAHAIDRLPAAGYLMYSGALATRCTLTAGFFSPAGMSNAVKWFCSGAIWQLK
ncbi:MAG: hypothetical protein QFF03_01950 [Pseudomonadota bacterium]|nr:hypothetical protein [Pseudomonadota bacterium]